MTDDFRGFDPLKPAESEHARLYAQLSGKNIRVAGAGLSKDTIAVIGAVIVAVVALIVFGPALAQRSITQTIQGPLQELEDRLIEQQASADSLRGLLADMRLRIEVVGNGGQIQSVEFTPPSPQFKQHGPGDFSGLDDLLDHAPFIPELRPNEDQHVLLPDVLPVEPADIPAPGSGALIFSEPSQSAPSGGLRGGDS